MNRKLMTILAGLSTAAAFAVNGSRRFRERRQILRQRGVYRADIAAAVRMAEKQYCNVPADDCIGADCDWCGIRFAYDDGYPSGKFGAAAV